MKIYNEYVNMRVGEICYHYYFSFSMTNNIINYSMINILILLHIIGEKSSATYRGIQTL